MKRFIDFQQQVLQWTTQRSDVQAVLLIGSLAREEQAADEWSDVDLILFTDDSEVYTVNGAWLSALSEVLVPVFERHQSGDGEWLVLFADGKRLIGGFRLLEASAIPYTCYRLIPHYAWLMVVICQARNNSATLHA